MGRPHIEFSQSLEVAPVAVGEPPFAGATRRLLSADDETGASTAIVHLPAGWSADLGRGDRPLELFMLGGSLAVDGQPMDAGCYAYVPATAKARAITTTAGADVLAMIEESRPVVAGIAPIEVKDTKQIRWAASKFSTVPAGLVNKQLHSDPESGDRTWVAANAPGWVEERAEIHPTVEEALMLRGDILLGDRGAMTPGCYFWRPPMVPHGPMYSHSGAEFFFRTKGGALEVEYQSVPGWSEMVDSYRSARGLPLTFPAASTVASGI